MSSARWIALSWLVVVLGCSSSSNGGAGGGGAGGGAGGAGGGTTGPTADQACTQLAAVRCAKRQECEPANFSVAYGDLATCTGRDKLGCLATQSAPGIGNTPAGLAACATVYPAWGCADWSNSVPPAACAVAPGSKAAGSSCTFSGQCSSGFCATLRGAKCGVCAAMPQSGTACGAGIGCGGNGLNCDSATSTCVPLVVDGGACTAGNCGYGFGCVADGGVCQAEGVTVDAGCDSTERALPACHRELGFSCVRRHCVVTGMVTTGQACGLDLDAGTFSRCRAGGNCVDGGSGTTTCVAPANDALACDNPEGPLCLSPARCVLTDGGSVDAGEIVGVCQLPSGVACQ